MKPFQLKLLMLSLVCLSALEFSSCKSKPKDSDLQASFNEKARSDAQMSNITATASEGVITLNGECPDPNCKSNAEQAARDIKGVTSVVNNITIAPPPSPVPAPEIATNDALSTGVRDAVKDHPGVKAEVTNNEIYLTGEIKRSDLPALMQKLSSLNAKKINNNLTIK